MKTIIEAIGLKKENFMTEIKVGWFEKIEYKIPTYEIKKEEKVGEILNKLFSLKEITDVRLKYFLRSGNLIQLFKIHSYYKKDSLFSFNDDTLFIRNAPSSFYGEGIGQEKVFGYLWFEENKLFLKFRNRLQEESENFIFEFTC